MQVRQCKSFLIQKQIFNPLQLKRKFKVHFLDSCEILKKTESTLSRVFAYVKLLLQLQWDFIRIESEAQTILLHIMHLPMVTWFFWSHGFYGNREIVLTGNEEGCISSLLSYTTTCTHKNTYFLWVVLWGKQCRIAVETFQEHTMSEGKLGMLTDILETVHRICMRQRSNNNAK